MTVKIDMDMPKSCYHCKFYDHSYNMIFETNTDICLVECSYIMFDPEEGRAEWCPLKECK